MVNKRIHALVHGRVQGVFFREYTRRQAESLGLHGWVRNLASGDVETEFEGEAARVAAMVEWLYRGSPQSLVSGIDHQEIPVLETEKGFIIRY
jgi:acylphosphatase